MGHVGRDKDQIEDETERNKHVFAVSLKDSAQEGRDNVGRDRDRISNVGRDGTRVPPFKGGTRKLCIALQIPPAPQPPRSPLSSPYVYTSHL